MKLSYLKQKKILLVDDEPQLRELVTSILTEAGFTNITTAGCVKEALIVSK